ncbi:MAG TPA: HdeD family acid-resistance protein [Steroidobacteraceae bacterium]|nr:HdeD family acid-resistance protein [Steroidobacteraceae bacterium]
MIGEILSRYWWMTVLRGVCWILFGVVMLAWPGISLLSLTLALGIVIFADGILNVGNAFAGRHVHDDWWVLLLIGLTGIGIGLLTFYSPQATALALVFYVAIWAIATGLLQIAAAIRLRKQISGELWLILAGLASVVFGVLLIARPVAGALTLIWLFAVYAIAFGVLLILLAFRVRSGVKRMTGAA